jgi:DnaJ-class molecular chaperone
MIPSAVATLGVIASGPEGFGGVPSCVGQWSPGLAGTVERRVCGTCGGRGSKTEKVRRRDTCKVCGGSGQKRTGRVTVPCSGCGGSGGTDRTSEVQVACRTCGGSGFR